MLTSALLKVEHDVEGAKFLYFVIKNRKIVHIFSECDLVTPLWQEINILFNLQNDNIVSDNFSKIFGIQLVREIRFLHTNSFALNIIFIYPKFQVMNPNIGSLNFFSKLKEILSIILPEKRANSSSLAT